MRVLQAARSKPLFLYVPLTAIHNPLQTTLEEAVQGVDRAVGRIVGAAKPDTTYRFERTCRSNGVLEARLLAAAG